MKIKESEHVELKKSTSLLKEGVISICSILNKHDRGEPDAEFSTFAGLFVTTFKRKYQDNPKLVDGLVDGLVDTQRKIIELVSKNPKISKKEMSEKIGVSTTAIDKNIATLKKKGILLRTDDTKKGQWKIIKRSADKGELQ